MLDLDLSLDALMNDTLNNSHLYTVQLNPHIAECIKNSAKVNGNILDAKCPGVTSADTANGLPPADVNGKWLQLKTTRSKLSEEKLRETFGHFGAVERIDLPAKPGKHAFISE